MDMKQKKLRLNLDDSFNIKTKKLRTISNDKNILINSIENLSNELFYEIFDYLDGCDIYKAFSNLNYRLEQLITYSSLLLKIKFFNQSKSEIKHFCEHVIIPNRHRIISLHLCDSILNEEFFTHCIIDLTYIRLESVSLYGLSTDIPCNQNTAIHDLHGILMAILFYFKSLPRLFALTISHNNDYYINRREIYSRIFDLPYLKYSSLTLSENNEMNNFEYYPINEHFNNIECLTINHICTLNELIWILSSMPRLNRLDCFSLIQSKNNHERHIEISLLNLTYLRIWQCYVKFSEFENFIKKISSKLQVLHIDKFYNRKYVDPNQWKQLILQDIPHLHKFELKCYIRINVTFNNIPFHSIIHQSTSRFWIERRWIFGIQIKDDKLYYSIHPYRKSWFNIDSIEQITSNSSIQFPNLVELSIINDFIIDWNTLFMVEFPVIFREIHITSLYIFVRYLSCDNLIKLIGLLPNVNSLKLLCPPKQHFNTLLSDDKEKENLHLVSINNKITKVYQSSGFELTDFLINFCPRMEHLAINWIAKKDLNKLVSFILMKTTTHIHHLHSLCFRISNANDTMIVDLQKMIDSKKFLYDYHIKRQCNVIILQRK